MQADGSMGAKIVEGRFWMVLIGAILASGCGSWRDETEANHPPSVPSILSAVATGPHEIGLTWTPSTDDHSVVEYQILRDGKEVSSTPAISFTDSGLQSSTVYRYEVRAVDNARASSPPSEAALATTPPGTIVFTDWRSDRLVAVDDMEGTGWRSVSRVDSDPTGLQSPSDVVWDAQRRISLTDRENSRIVRMDDMTGLGWASLSIGAPAPAGVEGQPAGLAIDESGRIYVSDWTNDRIVRVDDFAGTNPTAWGSLGTGAHTFTDPADVAVDVAGRIYVVDSGNHRIVRMDDMDGTGWTTYGKFGVGEGQFNQPLGIAVDGGGRIYVSDHLNHRIVRIDDMNGAGWTRLGKEGPGGLPVWGAGVGEFYRPIGVAVDVLGRLYVADTHNFRIVRVDDMRGAGWKPLATQDDVPIRPVGIAVR